MMARYHQPFSEVRKMHTRDIMFFCNLAEAEDWKMKKDIDKQKAELKARR